MFVHSDAMFHHYVRHQSAMGLIRLFSGLWSGYGQGIIGSLDWAGLRHVGGLPFKDYAETIPHSVFMIFSACSP